MSNIEIWKTLPYPSFYEVSNFGNVRALSRKINSSIQPCGYRITNPKTVSITDNGRGYKLFSTSINRKRKNLYVHRVVAELFIPNPDKLPEVNHIDGDKSNNKVSNLEWVTLRENRDHAIQNGLN